MRNIGIVLLLCLALTGTNCVSTHIITNGVSPTSLDFGSVASDSSNTLSALLYNPTATELSYTIRSSDKRYCVRPDRVVLQPNETRLLRITYAPGKQGQHQATISFRPNILPKVQCHGKGNPHQPTRDKYAWPFSQESIWNTPIKSNAVYVPAGLKRGLWIATDNEILCFEGREQTLFGNGQWPGVCSEGKKLSTVFIPDGVLIQPDNGNSVSAFVLADGNTIYQANPTARCDPTGPVYAGWKASTEDIYGSGRGGGHGGSQLATLGGSIRLSELTSPNPIRHVLKLDIWAAKYCSKTSKGYRWPAYRADAYYQQEYDKDGTAVPAVRMGSLLALPLMALESLELKTPAGRKLAYALSHYGAYIVDDSAWDAYNICVERGVEAEFEAAYGYPLTQKSGPWYDDMMVLLEHLCVVDNNTPTTVGGGGQLLVQPAPPIGN